MSGAPGTADVTQSVFSSSGGDNTLQAVAIPDLADVQNMTIPRRDTAEFRNKLHQLVVVEFDGQKPSAESLDAVQSYLLNTDTKYCDQASPGIDRGKLASNWESDWDKLNQTIIFGKRISS